MAMTSDNLKSKRGMVGGAVAALLVAGGVAAVVLPGSGDRSGAAPADGNVPTMLAQMAPGGDPALSGGDPSMMTPGAPPGMGGAPAAPPAPAEKIPNSFSGAPPSYGGGAAGAGAGGMGGDMSMMGAPPMGYGGGMGGATPPPTADFSKIKPITRGKIASGYRKDPFDSRRIPKYERPPAYSFLAPMRLASRPVPPPPPHPDPAIQYGPLPVVPRRVAGILYNGSVSAILETGTPGAGAVVDVVSPGSRVQSGIPGVDDLTVVSIGPTSVILRADDGRTVTVPLSAVPAAYQDAFRNSNLPGGGMMGPGMGPGGMGGPGMMGPGGMGGPGMMGPGGRGGPGFSGGGAGAPIN